MKIALFKNAEYGFSAVYEQNREEFLEEYVRVSQWVDVEFPMRSAEEYVPEQIKVLDSEREKIVEKFSTALAEIDKRKKELLAIPHQPGETHEHA